MKSGRSAKVVEGPFWKGKFVRKQKQENCKKQVTTLLRCDMIQDLGFAGLLPLCN